MKIFNFQFSIFKRVLVIILLLSSVIVPQVVLAQSSQFCTVGGGFIKVPCVLGGELGPAGKTTFGGITVQVISIALLVVGSLAVIFLIWGGARYITARGNEEQAEDAKKIIKNAIIGVIVVIFSFAVVNVIAGALITGRP